MSKKPVLTPEIIAAGVAKNASEYNARVEALRALHSEGAYNPAVDPATLNQAALEATRGATPLPAMRLHGNNEGSVSLGGRDPEAEALAKREGGRKGHRETKDEEGESPQGGAGDGGVQAGNAAFRFQARPQGHEPQAGGSDRSAPVWIEQTWEADTEAEVKALIPPGAKAIEARMVWKATALVRVPSVP